MGGMVGHTIYWHDLRKDEILLTQRHSGCGGVLAWLASAADRMLGLYIWNGAVTATDIVDALQLLVEGVLQN